MKQRGQATWDFLVISLILFIVLFGVVDYWMTVVKIQQAEHIKNYYLSRSRIEGMLLQDDEAELIDKFDQIGLTVNAINSPPSRIKRTLNISEGSYPEVWLEIQAEFKNYPFMIGLFLNKDDDPTLVFKGREISEYVDS